MMKPFDRRIFLSTLSCSIATIASEPLEPVRHLLAEGLKFEREFAAPS
jgi:hypothetical protein